MVLGRCLVAVSAVAVLAGCGESGQSGDAKRFAESELSVYVLDGGVSCDETSKAASSTRYSCRANTVVGGVTQQVTVVVQCVDGGTCSRVPT